MLQVPDRLDPVILSNRSATVCEQPPTHMIGLEKSASGFFKNLRGAPESE